ncbi:MAG: hypothetical protein JHC81_04815 [Brevundimonas sp.]|uniref:DUF7146 domain-containing protein n=1 Tax=Brevundimonas sp. TaxID=1871086 RepID=UPI001A337D27|nr:CHC2 zinc finger domain-containing protein [Brevundimonas sp.]MBJ7446836.1 hypothetical protein [Brevundimonas sp.]
MFDRSLFEAARGAMSVEGLAAQETDLRRAGSEQRGQCPLCGAGSKKSASAPFAVHPGKQTWKCYVCDPRGGDVVDLERALRGGSPVEAARRLAGSGPLPVRTAKPVARAAAPSGPSVSDKVALELWREARPIAGTLAERYLRFRGIAAEVIQAASSALRFHPFAKWGWDEGAREWIKAPAILIQIVVPDGDGLPLPTGGVHCTYLARDGRGKAPLDPAKRMWGPQQVDGRVGLAWLTGDSRPARDRTLTTGEGLETVLSVLTMMLRGTRGVVGPSCAALSLDRLQGGLLRDNEGRIDPYDPKANPERPAVVWPGPWGEVTIAVDRDMSPLKVKARTPRGKTCDFTFEPEARARLCARLAAAAWKAAGAIRTRAIAPSPGCDFNDELRRYQARQTTDKGGVA